MHSASFSGAIVAGHKEDAIEVPFDPAARWNVAAQSIRPGRRGVPVVATVDDTTFASFVVARSKRFWLLIDPRVQASPTLRTGAIVDVVLAPARTESAERSGGGG